MTYWAREHQANLRRIADMLREIDYVYEDIIPGMVHDLREDDKLGSETAVAHLLAARSHMVAAQGSLEQARDTLPKPTFYTGPSPAFILHPDERHTTAHHTMERDG